MTQERIPVLALPQDPALTYAPKDEPFVDLARYCGGKIRLQMKYAEQKRPGAITRALVRRQVADMLLRALSFLPSGYTFLVFDAWRPYTVQKSLYDEYFEKLRRDEPQLDDAELHRRARAFVSYPDQAKRFAFVHSSGGAIDLTLVDENGSKLDMGTDFDDFTPRANTAALEDTNEEAIKQNRRLLYSAMTAAGFTNFPNEWWHYDYGDLFYASMTGEAVLYPSVYLMEDIVLEDEPCRIS